MRFFDLHCDTIVECFEQEVALYDNPLAVSVAQTAGFEASAHCFALWVADGPDDREACRRVRRLAEFFETQMKECYPLLRRGNLPLIGGLGQRTAFLTVENGAALGGDVGMVSVLRRMGAVMMTLCWNGENRLAGGCESRAHLTGFGRTVVAEMERVGMLVDVSHLNDQSFYEVAACANEPLVASHSNARAVCRHSRNLTDSQAKLVADSGGLIGVTLYDEFIRAGGGASMEDLCRHVEHWLDLGLEDHIAVGTDFDGGPTLECIPDIGQIAGWFDRLVERGIPAAVCDKIFYRNAARFFEGRLCRKGGLSAAAQKTQG